MDALSLPTGSSPFRLYLMLWRAVPLVIKRLLSAVLTWCTSTHSQAGQRVCLHRRWFARLAAALPSDCLWWGEKKQLHQSFITTRPFKHLHCCKLWANCCGHLGPLSCSQQLVAAGKWQPNCCLADLCTTPPSQVIPSYSAVRQRNSLSQQAPSQPALQDHLGAQTTRATLCQDSSHQTA